MIDCVTVNTRFRNGVKQVKYSPGADCNSDHMLLTFCIIVKVKGITKKNKAPR